MNCGDNNLGGLDELEKAYRVCTNTQAQWHESISIVKLHYQEAGTGSAIQFEHNIQLEPILHAGKCSFSSFNDSFISFGIGS